MISTEQVIKKIKLFSEMPEDNNFLYRNDKEFLEIINSTFLQDIVPIYKDIDKSFFLSYIDYPFVEKSYTIPLDAYNRSVQDVQLISCSGTIIKDISQISISSKKNGFVVVGNEIILKNLDNFSQRKKIRLWYCRIPASLAFVDFFSSIEYIYDKKKRIILDLNLDKFCYGFSIKKGENEFLDLFIKDKGLNYFQLCLQEIDDSQNIIYLRNKSLKGKSLSCYFLSKIEDSEDKWIFYFQEPISINTNFFVTVGNFVNLVPLPLEGIGLLILRTIINMDVSERIKKIVFHRYAEQLSRLKKNSKKIQSEKISVISNNLLW